jgi:hypothetical protein
VAEKRGKKKIVRVESEPAAAEPKAAATEAKTAASTAPSTNVETPSRAERTWAPTPEAKKQATTFRLAAGGLWLLAILGEVLAIFWVLQQSPVNMVLLIVLIVVIGALAIGGSLLWKRANRLDPASENEPVRFFVQNQLGAIITIIAFLPLIVLILANKDMDPKQKGIAGGVAIAVAAVATYFGMSFDPPSVEQYSEESNIIEELTGQDLVYWTRSGSVFHVCSDVPDVNRESQDGQIYEGSVADAHAAGKSRLVSYWDREAVNYCGYTQEQVDAVKVATGAEGDAADSDDEPADEPAEDE